MCGDTRALPSARCRRDVPPYGRHDRPTRPTTSAQRRAMILRASVALCVARCAAAVPGGPADRGRVKDLDGLGALMALRWGEPTTATTATTTAAAAARTTNGRRDWSGLRILDGFFHRKPNAPRVTYRARDADGRAAAETTTEAAAAALDPAGGTYATEPECESANDRRPCVCVVPDFLDDLLDEAKTGVGGGGDDDRWTAECTSYQVAPKAFVVSPAARGAAEAHRVSRETETESPAAAAWAPVDFVRVVRYRPEKSNDGLSEVHYGLIGSDVKVKCLMTRNDGNNTKSDAIKWDYVKNKHSTNSTVTITSTGTLLISTLNAADSKNYTCSVPNDGKKRDNTYVHVVLAVEKPLYEVHGKAFYKNIHGGCTRDIITPFRDQLPSLMRDVLCQQDEQSWYACDVTIKKLECSEDKVSLEIDYQVTLNGDANFLTMARTTKNGRNAVYNQKMIAKTSAVLSANLKKLLTIQIISKYTAIDALFEPDISGTRLEQFVACTPGFGIREIFCAACQVHHYSPDRSAECMKCPTGFHQPIAGSDKCVKCPNVFASGCEVIKTLQPSIYLVMIGVFLLVCLVLVASCLYCRREPNAKNSIKKISRVISNSFGKLQKKYSKLSTSSAGDSKSSYGRNIRQSYEKIKKNLKTRLGERIKKGYRSLSSSRTDDASSSNADGSIRRKIRKFNYIRKKLSANKFDKLFKKKFNHVIVTPKIPFETIHGKIGQLYEENRKSIKQTTPPQQSDDSD